MNSPQKSCWFLSIFRKTFYVKKDLFINSKTANYIVYTVKYEMKYVIALLEARYSFIY